MRVKGLAQRWTYKHKRRICWKRRTENQQNGLGRRAANSGGRRPGSGRKKGTPNKVTTEIKELAQK